MTGKQEIQVRMLEIHPLNGEDREITGRRAQSTSSHVDHYNDFDFYRGNGEPWKVWSREMTGSNLCFTLSP